MKTSLYTFAVACFACVSAAPVLAQDADGQSFRSGNFGQTFQQVRQEFQQPNQQVRQQQQFRPRVEYSTLFGVSVSQHRFGGLRVTDVDPGSFAARNGLETGDVLLRVDGMRVSEASDLDMAYRNGGRRLEITVRNIRTGEAERHDYYKSSGGGRRPRPSGNDAIANALGIETITNSRGKMVVTQVGFGIGRRMGLRTGDVITGMQAVGIPLVAGRPAESGMILRGLEIYRPSFDHTFNINVADYGDVIVRG